MQKMDFTSPKLGSEVYIIYRVYKLGQPGMGMRIIVNPQSERRKGNLKFEADKYRMSLVV